jgi:site-specific DNA-methyltransferase (adenine-specific)
MKETVEEIFDKKSQLYQGDCIEIMREYIVDKSVDMILCDLPYGVTQNPKDKRISFELLWEQYERIIKDNGCIALFAQGLFYVDLVNSNRKLFRYDLIWDKKIPTGFLNARRCPLRCHEQIAVFYRKLPVYNPQFTEGKPLHSMGKKVFEDDYELTNQNYGEFKHNNDNRAGSTQKFPVSIVKFQRPHGGTNIHPTEKPVPLLENIIKTYSNEGDTVLDNCMGCGSTGIACLNTGRKFIGIEIDEQYFALSKKRMIFE